MSLIEFTIVIGMRYTLLIFLLISTIECSDHADEEKSQDRKKTDQVSESERVLDKLNRDLEG